MAQQIVNLGTAANDGTGDPLRTAFNKINQNFSELYSTGAAGANFDLTGNEIVATNSNGNIELVPNGSGRVVVVDDHIIIENSRTPPNNRGAAGDKPGMIAWSSNYIYVCYGNYDGSTIIWRRAVLDTGAW